MNVREPEIRQFCINCLRNCLLVDHQTRSIITLGGVRENIGKKIKAGAIFSSQPLGARYLTGLPNHDCSVPSWSGDHQGASSRRRTAGGQTHSDQTDSSLTTPTCASCHKKDKNFQPCHSFCLLIRLFRKYYFYVIFY